MEMRGSLIPILYLSFIVFSSLIVCSYSDSCSSKLTSSLVPFNTSSLTCVSAWSSEGFILRYASSGSNLWSFVLSAPDTGAYISMGFSSNGRMVGSSAIAGWASGGGSGTVKQYYLGGTSSSQCRPDQGSLKLVQGKSTIVSQSSELYLSFQLSTGQLPPYLVFAVGPQNNLPSSDGYLARHRSEASASFRPQSSGGGSIGGTTGGGDDGDDDQGGEGSGSNGGNNNGGGLVLEEGGGSRSTKVRVHGILAMVGWGIMMPIGIIFARFFKHWDPLWFHSHTSIQGVGFVIGLSGIIYGFNLDDEDQGKIETHKALGICILILGCLQVAAFLIRPGKDSKVRRYWNWYHRYVGAAAIGCSIGNIFYGFNLAREDRSWSAGYGIFLAVWVLVFFILEVRRCIMAK